MPASNPVIAPAPVNKPSLVASTGSDLTDIAVAKLTPHGVDCVLGTSCLIELRWCL